MHLVLEVKTGVSCAVTFHIATGAPDWVIRAEALGQRITVAEFARIQTALSTFAQWGSGSILSHG